MFYNTLTCDEHEDIIVVHRATAMCAVCVLEVHMLQLRARLKEIEEEMETEAVENPKP